MSRTKKKIGELLKMKRTQIGLTQQQLADKLSADRQYINKIESGKINMSLDYLDRVLMELGCNIENLFNK